MYGNPWRNEDLEESRKHRLQAVDTWRGYNRLQPDGTGEGLGTSEIWDLHGIYPWIYPWILLEKWVENLKDVWWLNEFMNLDGRFKYKPCAVVERLSLRLLSRN